MNVKIEEKSKVGVSPAYVALGPGDEYFVMFDDRWQYKNLPVSLGNFLTSNKHRVDNIGHLSISEDGFAWFVSFLDGNTPQWKAKGLPSRIYNFIGGKQNSGVIRAVELGSSGN